ncbi:MAG: hypothetical protein ACJA0H_002364 [Francisellaceae bacterium]|jgi:hypothetical protein
MELVVNHNLTINENMDELKSFIQTEINDKYNIVVTQDTVAQSKKLMANINKDKKFLNEKCKEFLTSISEPIVLFKGKHKAINDLYVTAYKAVATQVDTFEAGRLELAKKCLETYLKAICEEKNIDSNAINVDGLVLLGSITSKGLISTTAKDKIDGMVLAVEAENMRIRIEVEEKAKRDRDIAANARYEAEKKAAENAVEAAKKAEIDKEIAIQKAIKETVSNRVHIPFAPDPRMLPDVEIKKPVIADDGKRIFTIISSFEVKAKINIDPEKIKAHFLDITKDIGLDAQNVEVS